MFINFNENKIVNKVVKELIDYCKDDIVDNVYEELELWIAEYGLLHEIVDKVIIKLENNDIEVY